MTWMVRITGHRHDLMDWREALKLPFDPSIEVVELPEGDNRVEEAYLVNWSQFQQCADANEVREISVPLIRQLNGLMAALSQTRPVEFNEVVHRQTDGKLLRHRFIVAETVTFRMRGGAATLTVTGQEVAPPQPSQAQRAFQRAPDNVTAAIEHFARADNWHDLYKSFEALENHVGSRTKIRALGVSKADIDNFAMSAQLARHHESPPPNRVISLAEGQQFVASLIRACL